MLHVLKRLVLIVVAYLAAVLIGLVSIVVFYLVLSNLPGAPAYFSAMSLSPLVILIVPPVGLVVLYVTLVLTSVPALAGGLIAEVLALRRVWLHGLLGAVIGAGAFVYASPEIVGTIEGTDWADLAIVALAGFTGGVTYWLIAGRNAGLRRETALPVAA